MKLAAKDLLRLATVGSVDDGKSTLMVQLAALLPPQRFEFLLTAQLRQCLERLLLALSPVPVVW